MAINFNSIHLEVIDLNSNSSPDIFVNQNIISFSKRVIEDLGYSQTVQYCVDPANKVFAIRACKANDTRAVSFSKPKAEQTSTLSTGNKNLREVLFAMIPNHDPKKRYKITGEYDSENKTMYFDMATAEGSYYRVSSSKTE